MDFVYFLFSSRLHQELMGFRLFVFVFCLRAPLAILGLGAGFLFANLLIYNSLRVFFGT